MSLIQQKLDVHKTDTGITSCNVTYIQTFTLKCYTGCSSSRVQYYWVDLRRVGVSCTQYLQNTKTAKGYLRWNMCKWQMRYVQIKEHTINYEMNNLCITFILAKVWTFALFLVIMVCRSPTGFDIPGKISMKCIIHTEKTYISICKIMKISARKSQRMHFRAPRPSGFWGPWAGPRPPAAKGGRSLSDRSERAAFDSQDTLSPPKHILDTLLSKSWLSPWLTSVCSSLVGLARSTLLLDYLGKMSINFCFKSTFCRQSVSCFKYFFIK